MEQQKNLPVTYVHIRLSISFLLLKLVAIELIAAILITMLHLFLFSPYPALFNLELRVFDMPFFIVLVLIKMSLTIFVIPQWLNEYYEITADTLTHRKGVLLRREEKFPIKHMAFIEFSQGILGKLFNYGTISLYNGRRLKYEDLYQIHNPIQYSHILEDLLPDIDETKKTLREHIIEPDTEGYIVKQSPKYITN